MGNNVTNTLVGSCLRHPLVANHLVDVLEFVWWCCISILLYFGRVQHVFIERPDLNFDRGYGRGDYTKHRGSRMLDIGSTVDAGCRQIRHDRRLVMIIWLEMRPNFVHLGHGDIVL